MKKRVVIAMSGGVDSSTTAGILVKQGYEVIGISMRLPYLGEVSESGCCGIQGIDDARGVAQELGIPFYAFNYEREFEDEVINYFCQEYMDGRTPNPCIICNEKIKLGSLLNKARNLEADYIATGHYARVEYNELNKRYILKKGKVEEKDQSYFLFSLSQEQLSHTLFPLGDYTKSEVRRLAKKFGLKVYNKPASQEICFVSYGNYRKFLRTQIAANKFSPGPIINKDGEIMGKHQGIAFYTIGQRKGIGAHKKPLYVISIDKGENTVVVGEEKELYQDKFIAGDVNWIDRNELTKPVKVKTRIRYKHQENDAIVSSLNNGKVKVEFSQPQRAITPGQAAVFYDTDKVIGGGWII